MRLLKIFCLLVALVLVEQPALAAILTGSGFFITSDGYFVTNNHVIEGASGVTLRDTKGKTYPARIVRIDKANDLAILKAEGTFIPIPVANSQIARSGDRVITVGFPHIDVQGMEPKVTDGIINSLSGIGDDPRLFQISVPVQSGNSGGPLVNQDGNVVGIVVSKLSAVKLLKETGDLPQNVNYAVKSNYLVEVVRSMSELEGKLAPQNLGTLKRTGNLASYVEHSIALVLAKLPSEGATSDKKSATLNEDRNTPSFSLDAVMQRISRGELKADYSMSVVAPDKAENGNVVPFFVNLSTPIAAGDRLLIIVDDKHLAYMVSPTKSVFLSQLSGRVKMPSGTGSIRAVVVDSNGELRSTAKTVNVIVGVQSVDNGEQTDSAPTFKERTTDSIGVTEVKVLINYPSSLLSFIDSVTTEFSDGVVAIALTPVASKNPFVSFKIRHPNSPGYRILVKDNHGRVGARF